jgi:hypothetical protein
LWIKLAVLREPTKAPATVRPLARSAPLTPAAADAYKQIQKAAEARVTEQSELTWGTKIEKKPSQAG